MLAEFLLELVLQFVVEALGEAGASLLSTRPGRLVASAVAGFVGGFAWGAVLDNRGLETTPRTLWVAVAFALAGAMASVALRTATAGDRSTGSALLPWRWSAQQWEGFALLNACLALGVAVGFS